MIFAHYYPKKNFSNGDKTLQLGMGRGTLGLGGGGLAPTVYMLKRQQIRNPKKLYNNIFLAATIKRRAEISQN